LFKIIVAKIVYLIENGEWIIENAKTKQSGETNISRVSSTNHNKKHQTKPILMYICTEFDKQIIQT